MIPDSALPRRWLAAISATAGEEETGTNRLRGTPITWAAAARRAITHRTAITITAAAATTTTSTTGPGIMAVAGVHRDRPRSIVGHVSPPVEGCAATRTPWDRRSECCLHHRPASWAGAVAVCSPHPVDWAFARRFAAALDA